MNKITFYLRGGELNHIETEASDYYVAKMKRVLSSRNPPPIIHFESDPVAMLFVQHIVAIKIEEVSN